MVENRWNESQATQFKTLLEQRVYTSRLLGQDSRLVMHGGGNTSVKGEMKNLFGKSESTIFIKGSGWDLATIEAPGFPAIRQLPLLELRSLSTLGDEEMMNFLRTQRFDSQAPDPSVETLLHAFLPPRFIDHTHADAILTLTNQPHAEALIQKLYGKRIAIVPYVMPGFQLAKSCAQVFEENPGIEGLILMKHGIFTFGETARESYDRMIALVQVAEKFIEEKVKRDTLRVEPAPVSKKAHWGQALRSQFLKRGFPCVMKLEDSALALRFVNQERLDTIAQQGPLTPDHVIRTKSLPLILQSGEPNAEEISRRFDAYADAYEKYFVRNCELKKLERIQLDPFPRIILVPEVGAFCVGETEKAAQIAKDIYSHTMDAILNAEALSRYEALPEADLFEMEYWVLEQNKLKLGPKRLPLSGKIAAITGGAGGIGKGIAEEFLRQGAVVYILDKSETAGKTTEKDLKKLGKAGNGIHSLVCDVSQAQDVSRGFEQIAMDAGGVDIAVVNAGVFPKSELVETIHEEEWQRTLNVNLSGALYTAKEAMRWMKLQNAGGDIIFIASKNVPAPGKAWGAYSVSKAGQTQLARICALEGGPFGIRVNILHPHLISDTSLWTEEALAARAKAYNLSVEQYKKNNLLGVELDSGDVGRAAFALVAGFFSKTTGAQIAVDGGSDRTL